MPHKRHSASWSGAWVSHRFPPWQSPTETRQTTAPPPTTNLGITTPRTPTSSRITSLKRRLRLQTCPGPRSIRAMSRSSTASSRISAGRVALSLSPVCLYDHPRTESNHATRARETRGTLSAGWTRIRRGPVAGSRSTRSLPSSSIRRPPPPGIKRPPPPDIRRHLQPDTLSETGAGLGLGALSWLD